MDTLNQMELQDIRHTHGAANSLCTKIKFYKTVVNDQNALNILDRICNTCDKLKQDLVGMV